MIVIGVQDQGSALWEGAQPRDGCQPCVCGGGSALCVGGSPVWGGVSPVGGSLALHCHVTVIK